MAFRTYRGVRAVVTGAGSGLGRALCLELARRGAGVLASDLVLADALDTAAQARALNASAFGSRCDVTQIAEVQALSAEADRRLGGVDLLVNNAGVGATGRMGDVPLEDWAWSLAVNLWGPIHGCHVFAPRLRAQRSGAILNVASAAGLLSPAEMGPYGVAKAALVALSETLSQELAPHGVGVTVLCPTFFRSSFVRSARNRDPAMTRLGERMANRSRLSADDVARLALDAVMAGRLHAVVGADGRWAWRLKRLMPQIFYSHLAPVVARLLRSRDR